MFTFLSSPAPHPEVSPRLRQAGILLILFLCLFIPFRTPLADNTLSAVKAIPDLLIIALFVWYSMSIRLRYRFTLPDLLFIAFELLALVSTVFVNRLGLGLFIYQTRSIGIYYKGMFVPATRYDVLNIFGIDKDAVKDFIKTEKIRFKDVEDLGKLLEFLK
jgi:hypothetical protein